MPFVLMIRKRRGPWEGRGLIATIHSTEEDAQANLVDYVRENWDAKMDNDPPKTADELIEAYFDHVLEEYAISEATDTTSRRTTEAPELRFEFKPGKEHNFDKATREVVASLEGQRVRIKARACFLDYYNFKYDRWEPRDSAPRPLDRQTAAAWLDGWNSSDRFAAFNMLVEAQPYY